jgi:hypothetical protein
VLWRIGDGSVFKGRESAFGRHYMRIDSQCIDTLSSDSIASTEDLVAHVVLSDEIAEKLFIDSSLVDDLNS